MRQVELGFRSSQQSNACSCLGKAQGEPLPDASSGTSDEDAFVFQAAQRITILSKWYQERRDSETLLSRLARLHEFDTALGYTKAGLCCPAGRLSNFCYGRKMSKEDCIEMTGTVVEKFPSGLFSVQIDQERIVLAHLAGKLRRNRIRVLAGDRVTIEMSPYDLTKGRITYRHK